MIYVVRGLHKPLLGQLAIKSLKLVQQVGAIEEGAGPEGLFLQLFTGLEEYTIKLREGAKPFALSTSWRVPVPLMRSVKEELDRMERLGVIFPVEAPMDWCADMVVVPKSDGRFRICVDLTKLNESVYREHHPLPVVEQILVQAQVFSKPDANSGF